MYTESEIRNTYAGLYTGFTKGGGGGGGYNKGYVLDTLHSSMQCSMMQSLHPVASPTYASKNLNIIVELREPFFQFNVYTKGGGGISRTPSTPVYGLAYTDWGKCLSTIILD